MCSGEDFKENLSFIEECLKEASKNNVNKIFLPECFYALGYNSTPHLVSEGNQHWKNIVNLAKKYKVYLLGGSVAFQDGNRILNRVKRKSIKEKIDPKITNRIWKNMIWSYINFERRNFKKK